MPAGAADQPSPRPAVTATVSKPPVITFRSDQETILVSLDVKHANLKEILLELCRHRDMNIVFDPGVDGEVTARFTDVPWDTAFSTIVKSNGFAVEWIGDIPRIAHPDTGR